MKAFDLQWLLLAAPACLEIAACDAAAVDPSYWDRNQAVASEPSGGTGGSSGASAAPSDASIAEPSQTADAGETPVVQACFTLSLSTVSYGGEYGPDHVGAIWISRPDGTFVRTLEAWGRKRLRNAVAWRAASGGNVVDAITGATRQEHGAHSVSWDCAGAPPGPFVAHVEYTEDDSAEGAAPGPHRELPFDLNTKGTLTEADDATYRDIVGVVP